MLVQASLGAQRTQNKKFQPVRPSVDPSHKQIHGDSRFLSGETQTLLWDSKASMALSKCRQPISEMNHFTQLCPNLCCDKKTHFNSGLGLWTPLVRHWPIFTQPCFLPSSIADSVWKEIWRSDAKLSSQEVVLSLRKWREWRGSRPQGSGYIQTTTSRKLEAAWGTLWCMFFSCRNPKWYRVTARNSCRPKQCEGHCDACFFK